MLTATTETPAAVLFGLGPVLKCFLILPATDSWCSFSGRPSSWRIKRARNKEKKHKRKIEIHGSEVEIWVSGQDFRNGRGQRPVSQGFLLRLAVKDPATVFLSVCVLTAGPTPSDPRRFVSKTNIFWLRFLIKSIFNLGPMDVRSRKS